MLFHSYSKSWKVLASVCSHLLLRCAVSHSPSPSPLFCTDHTPPSVDSSLLSNTLWISGTTPSTNQSKCLPFLPAPCRDNGLLLLRSIFSSAGHNWLLLYSSESRSLSLCYQEVKLFHSICQNILLPCLQCNQAQEEDAAPVSPT